MATVSLMLETPVSFIWVALRGEGYQGCDIRKCQATEKLKEAPKGVGSDQTSYKTWNGVAKQNGKWSSKGMNTKVLKKSVKTGRCSGF